MRMRKYDEVIWVIMINAETYLKCVKDLFVHFCLLFLFLLLAAPAPEGAGQGYDP